MSFLTWYVKRRIRKGDLMDLVKFVLGARFVNDWFGLHRRDVVAWITILQTVLGLLTSADLVAAFPHMAGVQTTALSISGWLAVTGLLDKVRAAAVVDGAGTK